MLHSVSRCFTHPMISNDIQFLECNLTTANSFILIGPELLLFFLSQFLQYSHFPIIWLIKQVTITPCTCEKASVSQKENWQTCEAFDRCGVCAHGHSLHLSLSFSFFPFQSSYSDSWAQSYISHFVSHTHTHMLCESPVLSVCCCVRCSWLVCNISPAFFFTTPFLSVFTRPNDLSVNECLHRL